MPDGRFFREILGIPEKATKGEIRRAYRLLARENHPDFFPSDRKQAQELRMIALNEAYAHLLRFPGGDGGMESEAAGGDSQASKRSRTAASAGGGARQTTDRRAVQDSEAPSRAVALPKDPAYAYYKQGFLRFSTAVHGIAEISERAADSAKPGYFPRYNSAQDFAYSLRQLAAARGYFSRVAEEHPQSAWCADAKVKLRRIDGFVRIYRRILENLGAGGESSPGGIP